MDRSWWMRFAFLVGLIAFGVSFVYPTLSGMDVANTKYPFKQKLNLGLDLQGGIYLVMGVDFNKVYKDVLDRQASSLRERLKEKEIPFQSVEGVGSGALSDDPRASVSFDPSQKERIHKLIKDEYFALRLTGEKDNQFELGLSHEYRIDSRDKTITQSIEVIRNRIDEFGVAEPSISSQGSDRIVVELPGIREIERAKDLIGRTAKLEFRIVDDAVSPADLAGIVSQIETENKITFQEGTDRFSEYVAKINQHAQGKIPAGRVIAFERAKDEMGGGGETRIPYLLTSEVQVTGEDLEDALVQFDQQNNRPHVAFRLNPRGAVTFEKLTGENIQKRLAIVLDNMVYSAPVIQSKIGANGQITLGRGAQDQLMKEAKDLAIVLRAGALPAQLELLEQRVVGPSLGADSIRKGAMAGIIGAIAIILFILFYYRASGAIAALSLVINVLLVLVFLVGLEATLTLPGIAGIGLTIGIAVDSNVVIYERIREELRIGKTPTAAVTNGFDKAIRTIMDANVTNALAALVLLTYGTGPIKGFAVTLLIGIVTTLFTAIFVCRLCFDAYLHRLESREAKSLSI